MRYNADIQPVLFFYLEDRDGETGHVFISYQWEAKPTVLTVRDRLKSAGFRVWIDEDNMCKLFVTDIVQGLQIAVRKICLTDFAFSFNPRFSLCTLPFT